jgi:hypothetical protein
MSKQIPDLVWDYISGKTQQEIRDTYGMSHATLLQVLDTYLSPELIGYLKSSNYRNSKVGNKNPMFGKKGSEHHNFKGVVADGKGYLMVTKPSWYTGRKGCKHVFQHHVVMCESLGITEIPSGFHVHHINGVKTDNRISNLSLLEAGAHTRLHWVERATTIPQGSRGKPQPRSASHSSPNKGE